MKKTLLLLLAVCCLTLPAQAADFYDLPQGHWAQAEIQRAVEAGVVNGYGDGSFQPAREVSAAQFCAMLSRSFLAEEFAAAPEGKYQAMAACLPVLADTAVEDAYRDRGRHWDRFADRPLTRYDMAQILYNTLREKDALDQTVHLSATEIADYGDIPDRYLSAVFTCWGLGLLQGQSGGRFAGEDLLNRAQAAVIWSRLDEFLNGPPETPEDPDAGVEVKEMPAFGIQGDETVQEMMRRVNGATPRCEEGRLPNGRSRTEENIQELLDLAKEGCPDGTVWTSTVRYDYRAPGFGPVKGCLSFGLAVSDFVYGEEAPITQHRNFRTLAVGDVLYIQGGGAERVLILTGVDREEDSYTACELTLDGKVKWDAWGPLSGLVDAAGFTTVYSRWK